MKRKRKLKKSVKIFLLVIVLLTITVLMIPKNKEVIEPEINQEEVSFLLEQKVIDQEGENFKAKIEYPFYNNKDIDRVINLFVTKKFYDLTKSEKYNTLEMNYEIYNIGEKDFVVFEINSTLEKDLKYKTFLIDTKEYSVNKYENILDMDALKTKVLKKLENRYSDKIISGIKNIEFANLDYLFNKDYLLLYFYDLKTSSMSYTPYIKLNKSDLKNILKESVDVDKTYKIDSIKKNKNIVLTFDDGPGNDTEKILDVLKEYDAKATFFVLGNRIKTYSSVILRELNEGHEIGSHTYSHKDLVTLSDSGVLNQINSTNTAFNSLTGKHIKLVRPPYGSFNDKVSSLVNYPLILWNVDSKDWEYRDATKTANWILKKASDGAIVLMHDIHKFNVETLKQILPELEARGYNFITVSDLASKNGISLQSGYSYRYIR